jgi:MarR family 2-MHQ and catechol resistance regulon transcriptional repressor
MEIGKEIQSSFKSPQQKAIINIRYTSNWMLKKQNQYMSKHDISMPQFNILRILRGAKGELSINTIKERMIEKSPNTTRLMDKLIDKELIERYRDDCDKRIIKAKITNKGLDLLAAIDVEFEDELLLINVLSNEEAEQLSNLLDKLRD